MIVTKKYLRAHPNEILVFGDNNDRIGCGGAAKLRYEDNVYGFITKKHPNTDDNSYYKSDEYKNVFDFEYGKLEKEIISNPNKKFLISKIGSGLANKYGIFECIIEEGIKRLEKYKNVRFLW